MQKEEFEDKVLVLDTPTAKLKMLAKGDSGTTVTLFIDKEGNKVAFCSLFVGLRMKWYTQGTALVLTAAIESMEIELLFECYDLTEIV